MFSVLGLEMAQITCAFSFFFFCSLYLFYCNPLISTWNADDYRKPFKTTKSEIVSESTRFILVLVIQMFNFDASFIPTDHYHLDGDKLVFVQKRD